MNPNALYYQDSHCTQFQSRVTGCRPQKNLWAVTLAETAFYPEGGGQPCDQGLLGDARVLDVREQEGEIVHLCDRPLEPGALVEGRLDWARRFDLMQQHSGEHILSGIIHAAYGFHNVGFHMGADTVTIDFDGIIPQEDLPGLEARANEAIWKNLEVKSWFASGEELASLPYRSKKPLSGLVRLVAFPGYDLCACCGTHVSRTGEIGLLKLLSWAKFHQGVRMEMVCGGRALGYLSRIYEQNRLVSQAFSAKPMETGEAARKVLSDLEAAKARAAGLEARVFDALAEAHRGSLRPLLFEPGLTPDSLRRLADKLGDLCQGPCFVLSGDDESGYRYALCTREGDLRPLSKALNATLNGRGGGKPGFIQGSLQANRAQVEAFWREP